MQELEYLEKCKRTLSTKDDFNRHCDFFESIVENIK